MKNRGNLKTLELRLRFQEAIADSEQRKAYVYLLTKFVKSYQFLRCFFSYSYPIKEFAEFADFVGPQLIKAGSVSDMMKLVRATTVVRAAVIDQGTVDFDGSTKKPKPRKGTGGSPPPIRRVSIADMLDRIREEHQITEEEALYIKQVTEEKTADDSIRTTVIAHCDDEIFLGEVFQKQVKDLIQRRYGELGRYEELIDEKYVDDGAIFDIMAVTVIGQHAYQPRI